MNKLSYSRNGIEYAINATGDVSDSFELLAESFGVPVATVTYLLQYGFKQSLQDAAAQPASEASKEDDSTPESVAAAIDGAMSKRLAAIVAGTVATRAGVGRVSDPFESMCRAVIDELLRKQAKKIGKPMPKGDELTTLRAAVREKHKALVEGEANKRLQFAIDEVDLSN